MSDEFKYPSPDGRYGFLIEPWEARASLWVEHPTLVNRTANQILLKFKDDRWSLDSAAWRSDVVVVMTLRKFPGDHRPPSFNLMFDCDALTATVGTQEAVSVVNIETSLERLYRAAKHG